MQNPQEVVVENGTCLLNIPLTLYYYVEFHLGVQSKYTGYSKEYWTFNYILR